MREIRPHNQQAAATWGAGGSDYDKISEHVADSIEHLVRRIDPMPEERFLDVATGTGWTARRLAARGANVVGIDLGGGVIEAAKSLAPEIEFHVGDAEALAFEDESFDGVTSTYGVMFAARPEDAARELTRVCKKGGRIGLLTWVPGVPVEGFFAMMKPYLPPPSPRTTVAICLGAPRANSGVARTLVRSWVRGRYDDAARAKWAKGLGPVHHWIWANENRRGDPGFRAARTVQA
jgi:ubiquinone/menaquinone biosynthesis C-methylase UbiE